MKRCKIVAVGDEAVGKTALFMACSRETRCIDEHEPLPSIQDHQFEVHVDDTKYLISLWDTSGKRKDDELRHLGYPETSIFLVCFDVSKRDTFQNVELRWLSEIRRYQKDVPIILIANKIDLRREMEGNVRSEEATTLAHKHGWKYIECSAITGGGIEDIIPTAIRSAFIDAKNSKGRLELSSTENRQKCLIY